MPDASDPRDRAPLDWGDAFAALPPETPPGDAWSRVSARLDARAAAATPVPSPARHRGRRGRFARRAGWLGAATAAALALAVAWPRHEPMRPTPAHRTADVAAAKSASPAIGTTQPTQAPPRDTRAAGANAAKRGATTIALPKAVEAARGPRLADAGAAPVAGGPARANEKLDALYAESARLETLLALARDDRVASASALLFASALDAQVAAIDARLAQPDLDATQRASLWEARVEVLRQAAGFESTQRMLAAQGGGGTLLVSVD